MSLNCLPLVTINMGRKEGGCCALSGGLRSHLSPCGSGRGLPVSQVTSRSIRPFVHNRHKPKIGGCCATFLGGAGSHITQCDHGRGLLPYQVAFLLDPSSRLATIYAGPKMGVAAVPLRAVAGTPSNTMWPGPRPTSIRNDVVIHPAVLLQQAWAENWGLCLFWGSWVSV